jgi:predicted RNA binding protein YcfA (HicA-like mRNA interferase family)
MPKKIRELKGMLKKAGFLFRQGKGSHTLWIDPDRPDNIVCLSGNDGDDAKPYQEREVRNAVRRAQEEP